MPSRRLKLSVTILCLGLMGCSDIFRPSYDYAQIVVSAVDLAGQPVPGVRLTLYSGDLHMEAGVTRSDGAYRFRFVPAGGYGVQAGAPQGYHFPSESLPYRLVQVGQGEHKAVDFVFEGPT
jgi:hypothetical protein